MKLRKLYYEDCHLSCFNAQVLSCEKTEKGYLITLDQTAFYPEGGGQASDTGTLGGVQVLAAWERTMSFTFIPFFSPPAVPIRISFSQPYSVHSSVA